jgi:hypothetical protein
VADDVLEIHMQTPGYGMGEPCVACGQPSSGFHGLPVFNGDIVSNDWPGEWGGVPCCLACFYLHEQGKLKTWDHLYTAYLDGLRPFADGGGI